MTILTNPLGELTVTFLKVTGEVKEGDSKDKLGNVKSGKGYLEIFFVPFIHVFGTSI